MNMMKNLNGRCKALLLACSFYSEAATLATVIPEIKPHTSHVFSFCDPKINRGSLDPAFLKRLVEIFNATLFIESGTSTGATALQAASCFKEVHTIELNSQYYTQAYHYLKNQPSIHIYLGDSAQVLPRLLPQLRNENIVFWLDGHNSTGAVIEGVANTPIMQELKAIEDSGINNAVILIDDIRCFQKKLGTTTNTPLEGYPTLQEVVQVILKINAAYKCMVLGDLLLAYIDRSDISPSPVTQACTISRLLTEENNQKVLEGAEQTIMRASGIERKTIQNLHLYFQGNSPTFGMDRFYIFWHGLTLLHDNPRQAKALMTNAPAIEPLQSRINRYVH